MAKSIKKGIEKSKESIDSNIFRSLFEHSISGILYGNPDTGDVLDANSAAAKMFGYSINELSKLNRNDIFDFKHHSMVNSLKIRQENGAAKGELIGIRKSGERFPCEFSSAIFKNEKGENRTSTMLTDISDRKNAEKEILLLLNNTEESFVLVNKQLKIVSFNKQFEISYELLFRKKIVKGDNILDFAQISRKKIVENIYKKVLNGETIEDEIFILGEDGTSMFFSICYKPATDERDNIIGAFVTSINITDKINVQKRLKENSELFEKLTNKIPAALYQFEINTEGKMYFPYISSGIKHINPFLDLDALKTDASLAFAAVHPDDLNVLIASIEESKVNLIEWEFEYRSILDNNKITWTKGKSSPEKKADGTIVWYGYLQDITEQKNDIEKIRESKERYDIIAKATNDTIWDRDIRSNLIKWNKGIVGVFGYHIDESVMNTEWWYSKIHPDDVDRVRESVESKILNLENRWENEYRFICAKGTYRYVHDRGFLVVKDGVPVRMIGAMQDVTDRKQAEVSYKESELRFKAIFDAEPECVKLIDANGELVVINRAGIAIHEGNSLEEMKTLPISEFIVPEYREAFKKLHRKTMQGASGLLEFEIIGLKGTRRFLEAHSAPIRDTNGNIIMMLSVTRDVSARKASEKLLKESEMRFRTIFEAGPECLKLIDIKGELIEMNNAGLEIFEASSFNEVKEHTLAQFILPKYRHDYTTSFDKAIKGKKSLLEFEIEGLKGAKRWLESNIGPMKDSADNITMILVVTRDITQRKKMELEREQIIAELAQNNKDLKQFSYVTSHNLRAPIANLLGLTTLIEQYKVPNKSLKKILDGVQQSALMFDDTVKDLTKVLVIKDQTNIIKEEVSFVSVIDNVLLKLSISVDDVIVNYEFDEAPLVNFTTAYLDSILLNLFTNALKYKSSERKLRIDVISGTSDGFITLKFKDNGIGIDTVKHKDKLFKLYQRFHDNPDGKGLGLYLIKSQIEALGGTITIESKVGKGTTFIMKFKK